MVIITVMTVKTLHIGASVDAVVIAKPFLVHSRVAGPAVPVGVANDFFTVVAAKADTVFPIHMFLVGEDHVRPGVALEYNVIVGRLDGRGGGFVADVFGTSREKDDYEKQQTSG